MAWLVVLETALLLLLAVLVAGLLRSHAEILRALHRLGVRLDGDGDEGGAATPVTLSPPAPRTDAAAYDVAGRTPDGDAVHIGVGGRQATLLAFLSSGCVSCQPLWDGLHRGQPRLPDLARLVVVTRGPGAESPGRLRPLAAPGVPVVMSDAAWSDYGVAGSPYVVYLAGGRVVGEGSVTSWDQLRSLLARAGADAAPSAGPVRLDARP